MIAMEFERPTDRAAELAGKPGVVRFLDLPERRFVMIDGLGSYAAERPSIEALHHAIVTAGFKPAGRHHEIYLGDPRRGAPEKVKTLLRQAVVPAV